ncbi:hypothetical protein TL5118_01257 [Thalassovita autumnalis]|uniref:Chitin-binding type-2 domain-containing protein n=1 Tax=Thalassovita autumnalis TaxID=2072972 RepID=A0A0P1FPD8_9RHOB|nr:chitin-binding domain-containing protein [Thalassovita autumnalis]CUH65325.1 hypothetical protein TL5118_01257 [Thalassovita autumnalis]CUH70461.1 hypothetical protein TL5120_00237 [Thalassovita autumnalis]
MYRTLVIAALLTVAPIMSHAMGCSSGHSQQAMSCADGTVWDETARACVKVTG